MSIICTIEKELYTTQYATKYKFLLTCMLLKNIHVCLNYFLCMNFTKSNVNVKCLLNIWIKKIQY